MAENGFDWKAVESGLPNESTDLGSADPDASLAHKRWAIEEARELHSVRVWAIRIVAGLAVACVIIYFWHVVGLHCLRWLDAQDLAELRSIALSILSGVSASLAVGYFFRKPRGE